MNLGVWTQPTAEQYREINELLRQAKTDIAGGWCQVLCEDSSGRLCTADFEGVAKYSAKEALLRSCKSAAVLMAAEDLLGIMATGSPYTFADWEQKPGRKINEVIAIFDRALIRTAAAMKGNTQ